MHKTRWGGAESHVSSFPRRRPFCLEHHTRVSAPTPTQNPYPPVPLMDFVKFVIGEVAYRLRLVSTDGSKVLNYSRYLVS